MRVLFFSLNRLAFTGGAEKYILEVSRGFKQKGYEVTYLGDCRTLLVPNVLAGLLTGVKNLRGVWREFLDLRDAPSFPVSALEFITPRRLPLATFFPFTADNKKTRNLLKNSDLIFVKNEIADMLAFWWLTLFLGKSKTALLAFSSFSYPSKTRRGRLHNHIYLSSFYARLIKYFDRVVVSNRADIDLLHNKFGVVWEKINLIPYGLNPAEYNRESVVPTDDGTYRILFVGRLEEQKGVDILIDVINRLLKVKTERKLQFTIIGTGPWREQVELLAKEQPQVKYLGELPRQEVVDEYYNQDLLIVPSRWETFSYVTLEAQFCGLPVVAFDIPGPQDIIENGKTGQLVPLGSEEAFAKAVQAYVYRTISEGERSNISTRAKGMFSIEKTADALLNIV